MGVKAFTPEEIDEAYTESREYRSGEGGRYSLKVGKAGEPIRNVFRILPRHETQAKLFVRVRTHFGLGPNLGTPYDLLPRDAKVAAGPCLEQFGKPCPLEGYAQQAFNRARAASDPVSRGKFEAMGKALKAKERFGVPVLDMVNPGRGAQEFWMSLDLYEKILACFRDDNGKQRDLTHPVTGRNIRVDVAKKKGTNYDEYEVVKAFDEATPLENAEKILDQIYNLEVIHVYEPTPEQLIDALRTGERIKKPGEAAMIVGGQTGGASVAALLAGVSSPLTDGPKAVGSGSTTPPVTPPVTPPKAEPSLRKARVQRRALGQAPPAPASGTDPWAAGRAWLAGQGSGEGFTTFSELQETVNVEEARASGQLAQVPCFEPPQTDPKHEAVCRTCPLILPCATKTAGLAAA